MTAALYYHKQATPEGNSPQMVDEGTSHVCLHIVFEDAGSDIDDSGLWFNVYRSGQNEEGQWLTVFDGGDGTSEAERAHIGCRNKIVDIADRRGFTIDPADVTYGGVE